MKIIPLKWKDVRVTDGILFERQQVVAKASLEHIYKKYLEKGRFIASTWQKGVSAKPHYFYDSDVAKLIEAAAYSMAFFPNEDLKLKLDKIIDDLIAIQEPDGYLNSYFHNIAPEEKWTDLRIKHELYCAGHLIEAAIAWQLAFDEDKLLKAMCRYADLICEKFGLGKNQIRSYPGHEEIELALVKLYHLTGQKKYLDTAQFFIEDRGVDNDYWFIQAEKNNDNIEAVKRSLINFQVHLPSKDQHTAEGHAVRAGYFFAGMADIVFETGDKELWNSCKSVWKNIIDRRMNITGGIGSDWAGERFTFDYDLNEEYYYETCAQISLFLFAWKMFINEQKSEYIDIMELTLYNSILSGIDITGKAFFYSNPLVNFKRNYKDNGNAAKHWGTPVRLEDFECSCCPPNISRFIASIGQYIYCNDDNSAWVNLFIDSETELKMKNGNLGLKMRTNYPWDENISVNISAPKPLTCKLHIRIPGWARKFEIKINGKQADFFPENGYVIIDKKWQDDDRIEIFFPMPVEIIEAHPAVRQVTGKVALKRGPVVYCVEGTDNYQEVFNIFVSVNTKFAIKKQNIAELVLPVLNFKAERRIAKKKETLYHPVCSTYEVCDVTAIPYFLWANRGENEMTVWIKRN